eukprot:m.242785 g.242785  ORF g.242785 m.242785 type:complete len:446 (-) comp22544_c1_seq16:697-2034(-)
MVTPFGTYEWCVMPFGVKNAPHFFTIFMQQTFADMPFVIIYMDDLIIGSKTWEQHLAHVQATLTRLEEAGIKIKLGKCQFGAPKVKFLGYIVDQGFLKPDDTKIKAIQNWKEPKTCTDVRAFVGLVKFLCRHIRNAAIITTELDNCAKDTKKPLVWGPRERACFERVKRAVENLPALLIPDPNKPYDVHTDASKVGIGAMLMQEGQLVAFFSRKLKENERNYEQYEREFLAVYEALLHWRIYLLGNSIRIHTDNQALTYIMKQKERKQRHMKWISFLNEFGNITMHHVEGKNNEGPDALSRVDLPDTVEPDTIVMAVCAEENTKKAVIEVNAIQIVEITLQPKWRQKMLDSTKSDKQLQKARKKHPKNFRTAENGFVYYSEHGTQETERLYIPEDYEIITQILVEAHNTPTSAHRGARQTDLRLKIDFFWPGMFRDVEEYRRGWI